MHGSPLPHVSLSCGILVAAATLLEYPWRKGAGSRGAELNSITKCSQGDRKTKAMPLKGKTGHRANPCHSQKCQHRSSAQNPADSSERWQRMLGQRRPQAVPSAPCSVGCPHRFVSASPSSWNALSWGACATTFFRIIPLSSFP